MSYGERLKEARVKKGLKQTQVQEKTGINNKSLSGYENNVAEPDLTTLKKLSQLYEVSVDWLIGKTDEPFTHEEREVIKKIENSIHLEQITKEHEISYQGKVLNEEQKNLMLMFMKTLLEFKKE